MSCRKSGRSSKTIDYSSFGGGDDDFQDDDDDFRDCTPPVKKQKLSKDKKPKKEKVKVEDDKEKENVKRKKPTPRASIDDKIFERELQLVMEMSKQDSSKSEETPVLVEHAIVNQSYDDNLQQEKTTAMKEIIDVKERKAEMECKEVTTSTDKRKNKPYTEDLDKIEVLEEDIPDEEPKGRRRASSKKVKYKFDDDSENDDSDFSEDEEEDDDFKLAEEMEDDSDEDFAVDNSDEDEVFAPKAKKGNKKSESKKEDSKKKENKSKAVTPRSKPQVKATTIQKSKPTVTHSSSKSKSNLSTPVSNSLAKKSVVSSGLTKSSPLGRAPAVRKAFTPPSTTGTKSSLGGVTVKSPGALRLGLSKNARVKPLHSNVKIPT